MIARDRIMRWAPALLVLSAASLGVYGCNGGLESEGERVNRGVKEDVRSVRDFLYERGITIDTRLPER